MNLEKLAISMQKLPILRVASYGKGRIKPRTQSGKRERRGGMS